jgi:hypothetical protein
MEIGWGDNSSNEDGFRIERSTDGGATWAVAGIAPASNYAGSTATDGGRASELEVCYRVVAFNASGDSAPSNTACTTPPAAPSNLTKTWLDAVTVEVRWTDNSAVEDGYEVHFSDGESYCSYAFLPPNSTSIIYMIDPYSDPYGFCLNYIEVFATKDFGWSEMAWL